MPPPTIIHRKGERFGCLVIECRAPTPTGKRGGWWKCTCDCGKTHVASGNNLRAGNTQTCGCRMNQKRPERGEGTLFAMSFKAIGKALGHHENTIRRDYEIAMRKLMRAM